MSVFSSSKFCLHVELTPFVAVHRTCTLVMQELICLSLHLIMF